MATKQTQSNTGAKFAHALTLKNPRITEKAANAGKYNTYVFDVAPDTTKNEIIKAFTAAYKQAPIKVNTVNVKPKTFWRRGVLGFGKRSKKAYIILPKGTTIDL